MRIAAHERCNALLATLLQGRVDVHFSEPATSEIHVVAALDQASANRQYAILSMAFMRFGAKLTGASSAGEFNEQFLHAMSSLGQHLLKRAFSPQGKSDG